MDWQAWDAIGAIAGIVLAIGQMYNVYLSQKLRTEIANLKVWVLENFVQKIDNDAAIRQAQQWRESTERLIRKGESP
jgi:hypothetical protein